MGLISSAPKAPSNPQVVYVPAPSAPTPTVSAPNTQVDTSSDEQISAEARQQNLLRRNRGRFGTIQTGFRGLFTSGDSTNGRKTLLGE